MVSSCLSNRQKKGGIDLNWQDRRIKFEICGSANASLFFSIKFNYSLFA